jgi:hypothetical protein
MHVLGSIPPSNSNYRHHVQLCFQSGLRACWRLSTIWFVANCSCFRPYRHQSMPPVVSAHMRDVSISLQDMISTSRTTKARLLHYFPSSPSPSASPTDEDDEPIDSWCGFHKDHSLVTGLCSAMYLSLPRTASPEVEPTIGAPPNPSSGLYIRTRGGSLRRVAIPADALAFQTGEALELATEGRLRATPHCVRVGRGGGNPVNVVSRETFALFMQPDTHRAISVSETFGEFSKRIFEEHYEEM